MAFTSVKDQWEISQMAIEQAKADAITGGTQKRSAALEGTDSGQAVDMSQGKGFSDSGGMQSLSDGQMGQGFKREGGETRKFNKSRDEYGFRMTDAQYEEAEQGKKDLDTSVNTYRTEATSKITGAKSQYDEQKGSFESAVQSTQAELDAARKKLGKTPTQRQVFDTWFDDTKMKFSVVNSNGQKEGSYWVPRAVVNSMMKNGTEMSFTGKGEALVPTTQGGKVRGQEMHDAGVQYSNKNFLFDEFLGTDSWNKSYRGALDAYSTAQNELNTAQSSFNSAKAESQGALDKMKWEIGEAEAYRDQQIEIAYGTRQAQIDGLREAYDAQSQRMQLAYGQLAKGGYTSNE